MATSPAILMTMIKLSEPRKPTTGSSPPDSETQAALGRYESLQNIGRRDPGVRNTTRVMNYIAGLTRNQAERIAAHPNPEQRLANLTGVTQETEMNPGPEFREAAGGLGLHHPPRSQFFQELTRRLGFGRDYNSMPNNITMRDFERSQGAASNIANAADHILGSLQIGVGRENINRGLAANNYVASAIGLGDTAPRVFFDRKNQLRNF